MKKLRQIITKYPLSIVCIVLIWVLSLVPFFPETPFDEVIFADKWAHVVMYGGTCCVIWWEYIRCHQSPRYGRLFIWAWLAPILMSGLLELLQEYATTNRNGDWIDLVANATGATLAALLGLLFVRCKVSR